MLSAVVLLCCGLDIGASPWPQMPPAQYAHAYHGKLTTIYAKTERDLHLLCHNNFAHACALPQGVRCTIVLPAPTPGGAPQIYAALRAHEVAHCNGWRHQ